VLISHHREQIRARFHRKQQKPTRTRVHLLGPAIRECAVTRHKEPTTLTRETLVKELTSSRIRVNLLVPAIRALPVTRRKETTRTRVTLVKEQIRIRANLLVVPVIRALSVTRQKEPTRIREIRVLEQIRTRANLLVVPVIRAYAVLRNQGPTRIRVTQVLEQIRILEILDLAIRVFAVTRHKEATTLTQETLDLELTSSRIRANRVPAIRALRVTRNKEPTTLTRATQVKEQIRMREMRAKLVPVRRELGMSEAI